MTDAKMIRRIKELQRHISEEQEQVKFLQDKIDVHEKRIDDMQEEVDDLKFRLVGELIGECKGCHRKDALKDGLCLPCLNSQNLVEETNNATI